LNKEKFSKPSDVKVDIKRNGLAALTKSSVTPAGDQKPAVTASSLTSSTSPLKRGSVSVEPTPIPVILPKQSGFVPTNRKTTLQEDVLPDNDSRWIRKSVPVKEKETSTKELKSDSEPVAPPPKQTCFLDRRRQQKEEEAKKKLEEVNKNIAATAALREITAGLRDNLTLKESIDKVRVGRTV